MKTLIFTVSLVLYFVGSNAQTASPELVSSAGDSFNNTSYQLDWSIGECLTATHTAGAYVLTQGFHQNSYQITSVKDLAKDINITVYPNPTSDFISLNFVKVQNFGKVSYTITNINGKILQQAEVTNDNEQLNFSNYANGVYFISVVQTEHALSQQQLIKSFKIIKN